VYGPESNGVTENVKKRKGPLPELGALRQEYEKKKETGKDKQATGCNGRSRRVIGRRKKMGGNNKKQFKEIAQSTNK